MLMGFRTAAGHDTHRVKHLRRTRIFVRVGPSHIPTEVAEVTRERVHLACMMFSNSGSKRPPTVAESIAIIGVI